MIENLLTYSIGSFFWGVLIALACVGILFILIKGWVKDAYFKPVSYIILSVLWIILAWNITVIVSAMSMKSDISEYESVITQVIQYSCSASEGTLDERTTNDIVQNVFKENPILHYFIGNVDLEGVKVVDIPHKLMESFQSKLNKLIWEKLLWSFGFMIIALILLIKTIGRIGEVSNRHSRLSRNSNERISTRCRRPIGRR